MARRVPSRPFLQRRNTPNRAWTGAIEAAPTTIPAGSKVLLSSFTLSNANIDETVLRTVGGLAIASDQAASAESQIGAFGLIRVSEAAIAIGITAIPGPVTDTDDDGWFVYVPFAQTVDFRTAAGYALYTRWYGFDSKAKRVFEEGVRVAVVAENAHATHGLNITAVFRMLTMVRGTG